MTKVDDSAILLRLVVLSWSMAVFADPAPPATAPVAAPARPYPTAHDAPLKPTQSFVGRTATYTQYRVEFNGIRGDRVPGYLYVPNDRRTRHPAALVQYGTGGHKGVNYIVALDQIFVSHGFVVLTIDAPMRGERRPPAEAARPPQGRSIVSALAASIVQNLKDAADNGGRFPQYCGDYSRAIDYLVTRPEVDPSRIGYCGISWGAITGITFAAHDPRVKAVVSMVGGGNFLGTLPANLTENVSDISRQIDPVYHVALIAPRPLLFINVLHDQLVPRFFAESLHKAAGAGAKVMWMDTDHFFHGTDYLELGTSVVKFLDENLPKR